MRRKMKKGAILAASCLACLAMATAAHALLTDWTISQLPIVLGDGITYTAVEDGKIAISNYAWD